MIKTVVLGNGNLATHLCQVFEKNNQILLLQNYNRKGEPIINCNVPVTSTISKIVDAEIYIIAFNDSALHDLSDFKKLNGLVVHTSGATDISVLKDFTNHGVFYPLQSFNKNISIEFSKVPIAIEANSVANEKLLIYTANAITSKVYTINSEQRNALHVAAVFANNFSTFMYTQASEICNEYKIDFSILKPIIFETISKLETHLPNTIQTGPAIRNDQKTIKKHLDTITKVQQKEIYKNLTEAIQNYYGKEL